MAAKKATKEKETPVTEKRRRLRKSPLRRTLSKLQELEPYALALIERSVKEETVDKESLATGRWIIQNLMSLTKTAIAEEEVINGLRLKMNAQADAEDREQEEEEEKPTAAVFSLFVNEAKQGKED